MEKKTSGLVKFFAFIGVLATIAAVVYAVYKYLTPEYLEDVDDDEDDDFEDDFQDYFEDEEAAVYDAEEAEEKAEADEAAEEAE